MLVNTRTGTFNLLGRDDYLLDTMGAGVGLGRRPSGLKGASGLPDGSSAYIIRYATTSTVSLVDQATVEAGAKLAAAAVTSARTSSAPTGGSVTPRGFAALSGGIANQAGSAAVANGDLWALVQSSPTTCQVQQLHPVATGHQGLLVTVRTTLPTACTSASIESAEGVVAAAWAGQVRLFAPGGPGAGHVIAVPATAHFDQFLPVNGSTGTLWFLGHGPNGWSDFGVGPTGKVSASCDPLTFQPQGSAGGPGRVRVGGSTPWTSTALARPPCGPSSPVTEPWFRYQCRAPSPSTPLEDRRDKTVQPRPGPRRRPPSDLQQPWQPSGGRDLHRRVPATPGDQQERGGGAERHRPPGPQRHAEVGERRRPLLERQPPAARDAGGESERHVPEHHPDALCAAEHIGKPVGHIGVGDLVLPVA